MDEQRAGTTLSAPKLSLDLAKEVRKGYVAYVAIEQDDILGGTPLSESQSYYAKAPSELPADIPRLRLDLFINAYSNPVIVNDEGQLELQLRNRNEPRRLVMNFAFLEPDFVAQCLADGILFSAE